MLKVAKKKKRKKKERIEKQKTKAITAKQHRARGEISLLSKKKDKSDGNFGSSLTRS